MKIMQKRVWSLLLVVAMVFTILPFGTLSASAAGVTDSAAIRLNAANSFGIAGGGQNEVYFGTYDGSPVKWRVLSTDKNGDSFLDNTNAAYTGNGLFLMSEDALGNSLFNNSSHLTSSYEGSDLQTVCGSVYTSSFSAEESAAVLQTTKTDSAVYTYETAPLGGDRLFPLSATEATYSGYGFSNSIDADAARSASGDWWLRSPSNIGTGSAGRVVSDGSLSDSDMDGSFGVRPAFNLNLSSVLFTSAAAGGKSAAGMDGALTAVSATAPTEWKLTLLDSSRSDFTALAVGATTVASGSTVPLMYSNAAVGTNEYVSAILADGSGNALFYGRVKNVTDSSDGLLNIAIPSGLAEGSYTLRVFSEQYNGDYKTDYASAFHDIPLTVSDTYINPGIAFFDKLSPADISVVKTDGNRTFSGILNGAALLNQGTDYTVSGNAVTIKKEYLSTLPNGIAKLTFDYGMEANNPVLTVSVIAPAEYLAFGDSIATGYGLAGYTPGTIPDDAYVSIVENNLGLNMQGATVDGLSSSALLSLLSPPVPGGTISQPNIKVVTLSIGSNDVLLPFLEIIANQIGCAPPWLQTQLAYLAQHDQGTLAADLAALDTDGTGLKNNAALKSAASDFAANFQSIISKLKTLAPNAKIYVTNAYNPYQGISLSYGSGTLDLGAIADGYIQTLNGAFDANSTDYTLIDVHSAFSALLASGISPVNASLPNFNFDPHPNKAGHALIANLILADYNSGSKAPSVSPDSLTVSKGGTANFTVGFGQGTAAATGASITVDDGSIVSVSSAQVTTAGAVIVTGHTAGTTNIKVTFNDKASTIITVPVTVLSATPLPAGNTLSDSGNISGDVISGRISSNLAIKPGQPSIAGITVTPTLGENGHATAAISQQSVEDAIAKALSDANAMGNAANGIGVSLNLDLPDTVKSLSITLSQGALQSLTDAGVRQFEINSGLIQLHLDLEALKEIQRQSGGDVIISFSPAPATVFSKKTLAVLGNRPVYYVTISYLKDGKPVNVTSLGSGSAALSIPYTPGGNEAAGYLFGVYVNGNGDATHIVGSTYDANRSDILLITNHFSIYGVGYTAPSAQFTDISNHWAKEAIDYAVGRGMLVGTSDTAFSPDTAMTRGMLVTVLGRLAGVDVSGYRTSSFTDVKPESAFQPYIEWAYKKGIIQGVGNGQFDPDRAITREEIAVILQNYAKATGYTLPVTRVAVAFADSSDVSSDFKDAVKAMQQAGIMLGGNNNDFNPSSSATRAEISTMLYRYIKLTIAPATGQGWAKNDLGQWMYFKDGKPLTGWQTVDGKVYCFNSSGGAYANSWKQNAKGEWFFLTADGSAATGWKDIGANGNTKRHYFDTYGIMVAGKWLQIDDKWYYFNADGSLAVSTKIDGYEVDENGVRQTK